MIMIKVFLIVYFLQIAKESKVNGKIKNDSNSKTSSNGNKSRKFKEIGKDPANFKKSISARDKLDTDSENSESDDSFSKYTKKYDVDSDSEESQIDTNISQKDNIQYCSLNNRISKNNKRLENIDPFYDCRGLFPDAIDKEEMPNKEINTMKKSIDKRIKSNKLVKKPSFSDRKTNAKEGSNFKNQKESLLNKNYSVNERNSSNETEFSGNQISKQTQNKGNNHFNMRKTFKIEKNDQKDSQLRSDYNSGNPKKIINYTKTDRNSFKAKEVQDVPINFSLENNDSELSKNDENLFKIDSSELLEELDEKSDLYDNSSISLKDDNNKINSSRNKISKISPSKNKNSLKGKFKYKTQLSTIKEVNEGSEKDEDNLQKNLKAINRNSHKKTAQEIIDESYKTLYKKYNPKEKHKGKNTIKIYKKEKPDENIAKKEIETKNKKLRSRNKNDKERKENEKTEKNQNKNTNIIKLNKGKIDDHFKNSDSIKQMQKENSKKPKIYSKNHGKRGKMAQKTK